MNARPVRPTFHRTLLVAAAGCLALAGCSSWHMPKVWPFHKKVKPGPEAVNELNLVNADGSAASYPQYWKRNTLVIDLSGAAGQGSVTAKLPEETTWPVRVALRVRPGAVGQLEVQAEERDILPVTPVGAKPVDIVLSNSLYTPRTAAIYISWSPAPLVVESAPAPEPEPAFVSPTVVPKTSSDSGDADAGDAKASDIVPPTEIAPAQPSPGT